MAFIWTGRVHETYDYLHSDGEYLDNYASYYCTFMEKRFYIQPGQTELFIAVDYDFITETPVGVLQDNDIFQISIEIDGNEPLAERVHMIAQGDALQLQTPFEALIPLEEGLGFIIQAGKPPWPGFRYPRQ